MRFFLYDLAILLVESLTGCHGTAGDERWTFVLVADRKYVIVNLTCVYRTKNTNQSDFEDAPTN